MIFCFGMLFPVMEGPAEGFQGGAAQFVPMQYNIIYFPAKCLFSLLVLTAFADINALGPTVTKALVHGSILLRTSKLSFS